jgi:S-adenosylmethionine hydrolase
MPQAVSTRRKQPASAQTTCVRNSGDSRLAANFKNPIKVLHCSEADAEHRKAKRQYAHTFHLRNVICVASAWINLPEEWKYGILLHEIGHLGAGQDASERSANKDVKEYIGVKIHYRDGKYGNRLESIKRSDVSFVESWLKIQGVRNAISR